MEMEDDVKKIDYFCLNQELVKISKDRPESKCVTYADMKARKRAEAMAVRLIGEYPELGDIHDSKIRTVPNTVLDDLAGIRDVDEKAKALDLMITALKDGKSPITGLPYTGNRTILTTEWDDIRRLARGDLPTNMKRREVQVFPSDIPLLEKVFNVAISQARQTRSISPESQHETDTNISRLEYFRDRLTSI